MTTTLYDIIDTWTMKWDRVLIDSVLQQVAAPFYKRKLVFFLLEEIWDALEYIDDPLEFMTEARKIQQIENLLGYGKIERAAKFVKLEIVESPELKITVLNAEEAIAKHPSWFDKVRDDEQNHLDLEKEKNDGDGRLAPNPFKEIILGNLSCSLLSDSISLRDAA